MQAQDAPLARFSIGMRAGADDAAVRAAVDDGAVVRTHILRPTWHVVAAEDLRWILELTSSKVASGMAARHRQLGLTPPVVERAERELAAVLAGRHFLTRADLLRAFREAGLVQGGDQLAHLVMLAELRGLVCSGPLRDGVHTYALVDEVVAPTPARDDRAGAVRELVQRFYRGHGPASVADLVRWTTLTQADIRPALAELGDELATMEVAGETLWFDPHATARARPARRAFLLPTFDEVHLSYPRLNFPRVDGHPRGGAPHSFAEAGGGLVLCDRRDAGWWKRQELKGGDRVTVTIALASGLDGDQRAAIIAEAERLAAFTGRQLRLDVR